MLCSNCKHKSFCKHYDLIISSHDVEYEIKKCTHYNNGTISNLKVNDPGISFLGGNENIVKPYENKPIENPYRTTGVNESLFNITNDCTFKGTINSVTPVEIPYETCSKCGKLVSSVKTDKCSDCGEIVCYECGYATVDINTSKTILTCDKCFDDEKDANSSPVIEWDISSFTPSEENSEETKEVKEDNAKANNRKSNRKSKKA